jgi:hypothetical protein
MPDASEVLERVTMNCRSCQSALPDLLLDPTSRSNAAARSHLAECSSCAQKLKSLEATLALLDIWLAPEPSAYFDQKLSVRLREEQSLAPAGWFERLKSHFLFNTGRQLRSVLAGGLSLVLLMGAGTYADLSISSSRPSIEASAVVQDLQILDKNDQALQTMDKLLQEDGATIDDGNAAPPIS